MSTPRFAVHPAHSVQELAERALSAHPDGLARWIQASIQGESIVLDGRVDSYYRKQLATEALRGLPFRIRNRIEVTAMA